mgnify:CR=1 FL=1
MYRNKTFNRKKVMIVFVAVFFIMMFLIGRLVYLMIFCSEYYGNKAENLHERERDIKAARGKILDANGMVLATNKSVCTISVIHSQIEDEEAVVKALVKELGLSEEAVRKRVEKVSSIERVKTNVPKETGDKIQKRSFEDSIGCISVEYAYLYPPGSPLIVPGERITKEAVEILHWYQEHDFSIEGLQSEDGIEVWIDG